MMKHDGRKLGSAKDVWNFVQGSISHAVNKVESKTKNLSEGFEKLGEVMNESTNFVVDKLEEKFDSSSAEEDVTVVGQIEEAIPEPQDVSIATETFDFMREGENEMNEEHWSQEDKERMD